MIYPVDSAIQRLNNRGQNFWKQIQIVSRFLNCLNITKNAAEDIFDIVVC